MRDYIKESSLTAALSAAPLNALPRVWDGDDADGYWIRAVCLVLKRDNSQSHTLAVRDAFGKVRHVRDFGHIGMIARVLSVYPYDYLDEPQFCKYGSDAALGRSLRSFYGESRASEIMELAEEDRAPFIREMGIARQLEEERNGTFLSSEEKEARRKEREEADKAVRDALADTKSFATTTDEHKPLPIQIVGAAKPDAKPSTAVKATAKKKPSKKQ